MSKENVTCIVAYDIQDDKVRNRLARYLEKSGIRLQKSVFAVEVERHVFNGFLKGIKKIADADSKVAVFRLCIGCQNKAVNLNSDDDKIYVF